MATKSAEELDQALAVLRNHGLIGRATRIELGSVVVDLAPETTATPTPEEPSKPLIPTDPETERESLLFASGG